MRPITILLATLLASNAGLAGRVAAQTLSKTSDGPQAIGVARQNAAGINLGARVERRLSQLPLEDKVTLSAEFASQSAALRLEQEIAKSSLERASAAIGTERRGASAHPTSSHPTGTAKIAALSSHLADLELKVQQIDRSGEYMAVISGLATEPSVDHSQASPVGRYRPEYLLPKLNPTFPICADRVWTKSGFAYQDKIDRLSRQIEDSTKSVGLFSSYRQSNIAGMPRSRDVILLAAGTGIAIGSDLVLTNQHVVSNMVTDASLAPSAWKLDSSRVRFVVGFPVDTTACDKVDATATFEVTELVYVGLGPSFDDDIAVVRVTPLSGGTLHPIALERAASYSADQYLGVIGYPDKPDPNDYVPPTGNGLFENNAALETYFDLPNGSQPKYRIARFGFGTLVDIRDPEKRMIGHDAPTDNSSSGSLLISLETGKVLGIHAGGNLGAGSKSGVNVAYRSDYILNQLLSHSVRGLVN